MWLRSAMISVFQISKVWRAGCTGNFGKETRPQSLRRHLQTNRGFVIEPPRHVHDGQFGQWKPPTIQFATRPISLNGAILTIGPARSGCRYTTASAIAAPGFQKAIQHLVGPLTSGTE